MKNKLIAVLIVIFIIRTQAHAQTQNYAGLFPVYIQSGKIYKRLDYTIFAFGAVNTFNETIAEVNRPAKVFLLYSEQDLIYNFSKRFSFAASYTYQRTDPFLKTYVNENRVWEQLTYKHPVGRITIKHRVRYDERFIENRETGKYPLSARVRYLIGIDFNLSKSNDKYFFTAYNEFFFTTSHPRNAFYSENWAHAGIGMKMGKAGSVEAGPIFISWVNDQQGDRMNLWYMQLTWMTTINISKKKDLE